MVFILDLMTVDSAAAGLDDWLTSGMTLIAAVVESSL